MPPRHTGMLQSSPGPPCGLCALVVPLLGVRRLVGAGDDPASVVADLISGVTGEAVTAADVEILTVEPDDLMLRSAPTPVEVRHPVDGGWHVAVRTGWLAGPERMWRPLVPSGFPTHGRERALTAGAWRPAVDHPGAPPDGEPVRSDDAADSPVHVALTLARQSRALLADLAAAEDRIAGTLHLMADTARARGHDADAERLAGRAAQALAHAEQARARLSEER